MLPQPRRSWLHTTCVPRETPQRPLHGVQLHLLPFYRARIIRRALDQGIIFALPESSSLMRRVISSAQAASASSSIVSSRLSIKEAARAARASTGSLSACSNSFDGSLIIYSCILAYLLPHNGPLKSRRL